MLGDLSQHRVEAVLGLVAFELTGGGSEVVNLARRYLIGPLRCHDTQFPGLH